jgi:hypothetical protein
MAEISRTPKSLELEQARRLQAAASQRDEFDWMERLFTPSLSHLVDLELVFKKRLFEVERE